MNLFAFVKKKNDREDFLRRKKNMHLTVNCEFNIGEIMHLVCL